MRILYLTQWFEPEPAFKGVAFARALADAGHDVQVVTGFPNYPGGEIYPGYRVRPFAAETIDGISVHRLPLWPSHDRSTIGRIANYLSFFFSSVIYCLLRMRRYDIVYVYHPPLTPAVAAAIAGIFHRVPFVINIQDLWPDSVAVSGMANRYLVAMIDRLCHFVYRRAAHIICQSDGMVELLAQRGVPRSKLTRSYNWSNYRSGDDGKDEIPEAIVKDFSGHINLVYGGNIGQAQALEHLVEAAVRVGREIPALRFHIVGRGIEHDRIAALAALSSDVVRLHPPVRRDVMDRIFEKSDILALHLKDDPLFDSTIPSKLQHYLSVGKPVLAGIGGEAAMLLQESRAALVSPPCDITGLANRLAELARMTSGDRATMGALGASYYQREMGFDAAMKLTISLLEMHRRRSPGRSDLSATPN